MSWRPILGWLVLAAAVPSCAPEEAASRRYTDRAEGVARWLATHSTPVGGGTWWPEWLEAPDRVSPSLASGNAGIVLFHLALADATGDERYLEAARSGGRWLLDTLPTVLADAGDMRTPESLYSGLPGIALTLVALFRATDDTAFASGADAALRRLHDLATDVGDGVQWTPYNDVLFGSAGAGLFLLHAAKEWDDPASLSLATRVGETLLARAEPSEGGLTWRFRQDRDIYLPNFSHGAAGIGYFLASLFQATGDRRYLDAALAAGEYLSAIARREGGGFILPYSVPNGQFSASWDIGWAHGPAGSARLFALLWQLTGDERWRDVVEQSIVALANAGVPGTPAPAFETEVFRADLRFGLASVAMFLLDWYQATGNPAALAFGREVVDSILARATIDSTGTSWTIPQYGFMPEEGAPATFTGYFYGVAGMGLTLLRLAGALEGHRWDPVLPDNPWGR